MSKWLCSVCNIYVYNEDTGDPQTGIDPGTKVPEFPDSWRCRAMAYYEKGDILAPDPVCWMNPENIVQ